MDKSLDRAMFVPEKTELSTPRNKTGHSWIAVLNVFAASCRTIRFAVPAIPLTVSSVYLFMAVGALFTPGLEKYALLFVWRKCLRWISNTDVGLLCYSALAKSGIAQLFQFLATDSKLLPRTSLIRHVTAQGRPSRYKFSLQHRYRKPYWDAMPLKCRIERCW